jgi:hypothetical protein
MYCFKLFYLCTTNNPFMYVLGKYVNRIMSICDIHLVIDGLSTCMSIT